MSNKHRGRPKGAINIPREILDEVPAHCPKCKSTERTKDGSPSADRPLTGVHGGRPYNRVIWTRCTCKGCGQRLMVREFIFDPEATEKTENRKPIISPQNQVEDVPADAVE
jgi:hypothetical protein